MRWLKIVFWVNACLTAVATLYFGWHYVADDVAGVAIALVSFYVGALGQPPVVHPTPRAGRGASRRSYNRVVRQADTPVNFWEFCESCSFCDSSALACSELPRVKRKTPEATTATSATLGGALVHRVGVTALALSLVTGLGGVAAASAARRGHHVYPSKQQVQHARHQAARAADDVAGIKAPARPGRPAIARPRRSRAEQAAERYNGARWELQQARRDARVAERHAPIAAAGRHAAAARVRRDRRRRRTRWGPRSARSRR